MTFAKRLRELMEKHSRQEDSFRRYHIAIDMENLLHDNAEAIAELAEEAERAAKLLDGIKAELYGSVYTVEDDEFDRVYFARDVLQEALKKLNGGAG